MSFMVARPVMTLPLPDDLTLTMRMCSDCLALWQGRAVYASPRAGQKKRRIFK